MTRSKEIIEKTAKVYGFTPEMLMRRDRTRDLAFARFTAWRIMCDEGMTHQQVGDLFGMNQSTVAYGCKITRQWEDQRHSDKRKNFYYCALQVTREEVQHGW